MSFIQGLCTEIVFNQLELPDWLRRSTDNPINRNIVYDLVTKVALIPNAFEHSTYPDHNFSLFISGKYLNVWEEVYREGKPYRIMVWVSEDSKGLDDSFLKMVLQQSFPIYTKVKISISEITIKGREPLPNSEIKPPQIGRASCRERVSSPV